MSMMVSRSRLLVGYITRHNLEHRVGSVLIRFKSTVSSLDDNGQSFSKISLREVPMLPIVGSLLSLHSGIPPLEPSRIYEFYPELRKRFGDFIKFGFPGFGKGIKGEMYVSFDPNEMMKVIRQEKTSQLPYPKGIIASEWPLLNFLKEANSVMIQARDENEPYDRNGLFGRGEAWKRLRGFLQTDLLSPQAAKGYIPGLVQTAQIASNAAPASADHLNQYLNRCAFDMFNSIFFGELTKTADLSVASKENIAFCADNVKAFTLMGQQLSSPYELIFNKLMNFQTLSRKEMTAAFSRAFKTADDKYRSFRTKYEANPDSLTNLEKSSYLARAIERQKESDLTNDELAEIAKAMLLASVDTTSSVLAWVLYHVAVHQDIQEKLYRELSNAVDTEGTINENVLKRKTSPYLHSIIRESHRLSPPFPGGIIKENSFGDVEIHGTTVPKDSVIMLECQSVGMDPNLVDKPTEFRPERWLDDAVQARKGTVAEVLDHPFLKEPFSQGSRKCPGSRVASNEVLVMLTQLVLDWKISAPSHIRGFEDMEYVTNLFVVPKLPRLDFSPH